MVRTSERDSRDGERRRSERRQDEKKFGGSDRRVAARRSGVDRRREPRE